MHCMDPRGARGLEGGDPLPIANIELAGGSRAALTSATSDVSNQSSISGLDARDMTKELLPQEPGIAILLVCAWSVAVGSSVACGPEHGVMGRCVEGVSNIEKPQGAVSASLPYRFTSTFLDQYRAFSPLPR